MVRALLQAGRKFCSMLVGANASSASVPIEHAIRLACVLRDHLVACSQARPESAEAPKQRKKRRQKSAPAAESVQVGLMSSCTLSESDKENIFHVGLDESLSCSMVCCFVLRLSLWRLPTRTHSKASVMPAGFRDARGLGGPAIGPCSAMSRAGFRAQPGRAGQRWAGTPPDGGPAAAAAGRERLCRRSRRCAEHCRSPSRLKGLSRDTGQAGLFPCDIQMVNMSKQDMQVPGEEVPSNIPLSLFGII